MKGIGEIARKSICLESAMLKWKSKRKKKMKRINTTKESERIRIKEEEK